MSEDDDDELDTFVHDLPWVPQQNSSSLQEEGEETDFLDLIHIEGTPSLQDKIKKLLITKYTYI